jgi:hypothetical protein
MVASVFLGAQAILLRRGGCGGGRRLEVGFRDAGAAPCERLGPESPNLVAPPFLGPTLRGGFQLGCSHAAGAGFRFGTGIEAECQETLDKAAGILLAAERCGRR